MHAVTSHGWPLEGIKGNGGKDPYMSKVVKERGAQGRHAQKKVFESERKAGLPSQLYDLGIEAHL